MNSKKINLSAVSLDNALSTDLLAQKGLENTDLFKANALMKNVVATFIAAECEKDIENIIKTEEKLLVFELYSKQNDHARAASLQSGLDRMELAKNSLDATNNFATYKGCIQTSTPKTTDAEGLPLDGFRQAMRGQRTSLTNEMRSDYPDGKKLILKTRVSNLSIAEAKYKEIQRKHVAQYIEEQKTRTPQQTQNTTQDITPAPKKSSPQKHTQHKR